MTEKNHWGLANVVWYDGSNAYVSKFVVKVTDAEVSIESQKDIEESIRGNGEVLKFDFLYYMDLENIIALKDADSNDLRLAFDRFEDMYF